MVSKLERRRSKRKSKRNGKLLNKNMVNHGRNKQRKTDYIEKCKKMSNVNNVKCKIKDIKEKRLHQCGYG